MEMPLVNVKILITAKLIAQYGNFRIMPTSSGGEIRRPAKYYRPIVQVPPMYIDVKGIDYEMMLSDMDVILKSLEYNKEYLDMVDSLDEIDISKINVPETVPVSEVPMEYVTIENGKTNKHVITADGIDGEENIGVPGIDVDSDDEDVDVKVEAICRYLSPNFIYQKTDWYHTMDLYEWEFVDTESKVITRPFTKLKPIKDALTNLLGGKKSKHE